MSEAIQAAPTRAVAKSERAKVLERLTTYFHLPECRVLMEAAISDKNLSVERCAKAAIATVLRDDFLWGCTSQSIFDCVLAATQLQMLVGKETGHAYIVPFKDQATLVLGYKGIVTLARRSGEIESIEARVVYKNELPNFSAEYGTNGHVRHVPILFGERGEPVGVYMFAKFKGGGTHFEAMDMAQVDAVRARSRAKGGPWVTDYLEMARKTVVKRGAKMLPLTADVAEAFGADDEREYARPERDVTPKPAVPTAATKVLAAVEEVPDDAPPHDATTGEVVATATPVVEPKAKASKEAPKQTYASLKKAVDDAAAKNVEAMDVAMALIDVAVANRDLTANDETKIREYFKGLMEERFA